MEHCGGLNLKHMSKTNKPSNNIRERKFNHGYKFMVIENKKTGRVENIRSKYNWSGSIRNEISKIKREWISSDYKVLSVELYTL